MSQPEIREVEIVRLAHAGDGETADRVFIPFTLPGDKVRAEILGEHGRALDLLVEGPGHVMPPCAHFGECGGCALQHMDASLYGAWKIEQVRASLSQRGISEFEMMPLITVEPRSRRRATLSAKLTLDGIVVGFQERGTHFITDLSECHVIDARLEALIPKLRDALIGELPRSGQAEIGLTVTATGIDMTLGLPGIEVSGARRTQLSQLAAKFDVARLTVNGEMVAQSRVPMVSWAGVPVALPPGAFLQAVPEAEAAMQALVVETVGNAKKVADLFSGCGTFTFALARTAAVSAFDGEADAIDALKTAAKGVQGLKPVTAERRDLFRRPLMATELNAFEAVVIDPPRAGAKAQAEHLAQSKVKRVVSVSCSPGTFARDARIMIDGGYRLRQVTPIDQFLWAAHVELVAVFERA